MRGSGPMTTETEGRRGAGPVPSSDGAGLAQALRRIEVRQGAVEVSSRSDTELAATLGSCVAVCLHDPAHGMGGMNHIFRCLDPGPAGGGAIVAEMERLVNSLVRLGSRRTGLRARVIGGAHVLLRGRDVGSEIAGTCLLYLAAERIPVLECTTGGERARRALFRPATGHFELSYPGGPIPARRAPSMPPGEDCTLF